MNSGPRLRSVQFKLCSEKGFTGEAGVHSIREADSGLAWSGPRSDAGAGECRALPRVRGSTTAACGSPSRRASTRRRAAAATGRERRAGASACRRTRSRWRGDASCATSAGSGVGRTPWLTRRLQHAVRDRVPVGQVAGRVRPEVGPPAGGKRRSRPPETARRA
jgi:hypothetical protein